MQRIGRENLGNAGDTKFYLNFSSMNTKPVLSLSLLIYCIKRLKLIEDNRYLILHAMCICYATVMLIELSLSSLHDLIRHTVT